MILRSLVPAGMMGFAVALLFGCGDGKPTTPGENAPLAEPAATNVETPGLKPAKSGLLKIAVIPKGTTHVFWKAIHGGAVKAEKEVDGVRVIWKGPIKEDDRDDQIKVVQNFINVDVDGIVIAPLDDTALVSHVREAVRENIRVVIFDSGLAAEPGKDYISYVSTDNYKGGVLGAQRLAEVLNEKGRIILLRYAVGSASTDNREKGFLDEIKQYPNIKVVSDNQYAGATSETAQRKAENLLNKFPDIDGIFCPNESSSFGMLLALRTADRAGKMKFVGFDSSEMLIDAMRKGEIHGLVLQNPLRMGYLGVKTMVAHLRGEPVQQRIDTGVAVATPENMDTREMKDLLSPPFQKYLN